ncbi:MAG: hypothetical protein K6F86_00750 [Lachnospiraceae bacterium]|nr:hypothetical protein [Lachnospiraceae bacterium]
MIREQQCQTVMEVFSRYKDLELKDKKKGSSLRFHMYMTRDMKETGVDALELSIRSLHVLKRAGFHTIGDLAYAIADGVSIRNLRNCGTKSAREIMEHLFLYQYYQLPPEKRDDYIYEVALLNCYGKKK